MARIAYLPRLTRDLSLLSESRYETGARFLSEIGQQVGGWLRHTRARGS